MLLWLHIDILIREVVVIVFEAILLRSCIGSMRTIGDTCFGCSLENTKEQVKTAKLPRGVLFTD